MVGLSLLSYVSAHLSQNIGEIDCDRVKTGIEGLGGNKGGAAWWQAWRRDQADNQTRTSGHQDLRKGSQVRHHPTSIDELVP